MLDGKRLTFGFEGIFQGTALLYDHQTDSLWLHFTGECIQGEYEGRFLKRLPTGRHTTWEDWLRLYPATTVLAPQARWTNQPSDQGYFTREGARSGVAYLPTGFQGTIQNRDERLPLAALVYGVRVGTQPRAYPLRDLSGHPVVQEEIGPVPVTLWYDAPSRSASGFDRRVDERPLTFMEAAEGHRMDRETGSMWTMDGLCVQGPLLGKQLVPLQGLLSEWYGWFANHPDTTVWRSE